MDAIFNLFLNNVSLIYLLDLFSIICIFSVFKYILVGIFTDATWPTHLFNKMHKSRTNIRFRDYNEFIEKSFNYTIYTYWFYSVLIKKFLKLTVNNLY